MWKDNICNPEFTDCGHALICYFKKNNVNYQFVSVAR